MRRTNRYVNGLPVYEPTPGDHINWYGERGIITKVDNEEVHWTSDDGDDYVSVTDLELSPNRWTWLPVDTSQLEKGGVGMKSCLLFFFFNGRESYVRTSSFDDLVPHYVIDYKGRIWYLSEEQYRLKIEHLCWLGRLALGLPE